MSLQNLGYTPDIEAFRKTNGLESFDVGRVSAEHKERYMVKTETEEYEGEIIGNLRFTAQSRADFPAVGDWVAISPYDEGKVLIHHILPRKSVIERQAVGRAGEKQIVATNIDVGFVVQAVDRDFNLNRLERYLTLCYEAHVQPLVILTKIDLIDTQQLQELVTQVNERLPDVPVVAISNQNESGLAELKSHMEPGKTYCLLGSSGVGKSSLVNHLSGREQMKTNTISTSTHKGRHITSHREMIVLDTGGVIIDNPGMREVGITDTVEGLNQTFETILSLASHCRFSDCSHTVEEGCAVIQAVEDEELDRGLFENFQKMQREKSHFESTVAERRKKDKDFGRLVKAFKERKKRTKE